MRETIRIITLLAAAALIITMAGCSLSGPEVSIEDRIDQFESDLDSNNWSSLYEHVHPDNGKRSQTKDPAYWSDKFDEAEGRDSYSFSGMSGSGDSRTVTVTQSPAVNWNGATLTFEMKEYKDGPMSRSSWYIDGISASDGPISTVL
ncbi:MAG: hypothetical protein ACLFNX_09860 [Spirochaetaceae bacterium]